MNSTLEDYSRPVTIWLLKNKKTGERWNIFFTSNRDAREYIGDMEEIKPEKFRLSKFK
jgi:hypothetical protein